MSAFCREIKSLQEREEERLQKNKKRLLIGIPALIGVLAFFFSVYVAAVKPFMPVSKITSDLDYYLEKVEDGYGSYSKKFYRLIDKQGKKLPVGTESAYRSDMYTALDDQFDEAIEHLEAGEVRYYDDAKAWASRFPEAEEQADRKEVAENALKKGLGTAVGETLEDVKEGARNLFKKAGDFIRDIFNREE